MLALPSVSEFVRAHTDLRPKLVESMEEAEEQPLPQNELPSQQQSSEIKADSRPTSAETVKAEEAKAEEIKAEPEEDSEPPTKKAKVQYGLAKWFKPEVKDHQPVVLEPKKGAGRPRTEMPVMTEALKKAYAQAQEAEAEKKPLVEFLRGIAKEEQAQSGAYGVLGREGPNKKRRSSGEQLRGVLGGESSNRRSLGQTPMRNGLPAATKCSIGQDIQKRCVEFSSEADVLNWAKKKYGLRRATLKNCWTNLKHWENYTKAHK